MKYIGGKWRQSKIIVKAAQGFDFNTYMEPFCGAMWSAVAMCRAFPDRRFILSDVNPYLMSFWRAAIEDKWDPPSTVSKSDYWHYYKHRDSTDPMCGYVGFASSFAGKFFGGYVSERSGSGTTMRKLQYLRKCDVTIHCQDFSMCKPPPRSLVYMDPPYEGRTKQSRDNQFDHHAYVIWAERLARHSVILATEFYIPSQKWQVLHDFGDTVVRHHNSKGPDGTNEYLMQVLP